MIDATVKKRTPGLDGFEHAVAESLFVLLPMIVIAIVEVTRASWHEVWVSPEWAFGAAVLAGNSAMKVAFTAASAGNHGVGLKAPTIALFLSVAIVALLVPSLVVLVLLITIPAPLPWGLALAQLLLFALGWLAFVSTGAMQGLDEVLPTRSSRPSPSSDTSASR
jgi:hypothetical protein